MGSSRELRRQRERMWRIDRRCFWCGVETIPPSWFKTMTPELAQKRRARMATLDHIRPKHHPGRHEPANGERRHVLSCNKCNNDRDRHELSIKPKEWFYENGQSVPLSMRPLEELQRVEAHLAAKNPPRKRDRESVARSLNAVREAIARKAEATLPEGSANPK